MDSVYPGQPGRRMSLRVLCLLVAGIATPSSHGGPLVDLYRAAVGDNPTFAASRHHAAKASQAASTESRTRGPAITVLRSEPMLKTDQASIVSHPLNPASFVARRIARSTAAEAGFAVEEARQTLAADVALAVIAHARLSTLKTIRHDALSQLSAELAGAQARLDAGLSAVTELYDVQARLHAARADFDATSRQLHDAGEALVQLSGAGMPGSVTLRHYTMLPSLTEPHRDSLDKAKQDNPGLQRRRQAVITATRHLEAAYAARLPRLQSSVIKPLKKVGKTVMPVIKRHQLVLPTQGLFFPGWATRQARLRVAAAQAGYRIDENALVREMKRLHRSITSAPTRLAAMESSVIAARTAEQATTAGYALGLRSLNDMLRARQRYLGALSAATGTRHGLLADWVRAHRILGTADEQALSAMEALFDYGEETPAGASNSSSATLPADLLVNTTR